MPETMPVNLAAVETTIRNFQEKSGWSLSMPARTVIHQLFISLATDQGGFSVPMPQPSREKALWIAHQELGRFLGKLVDRSHAQSEESGYEGREIGFPIVVHEMDGWAAQIHCSCWPR
jgi:hypothetical protein